MPPVERRSEQDPSTTHPPSLSETIKSPTILRLGLEKIGNSLQKKGTYFGFIIGTTAAASFFYWARFKYRDWKFRKSIDRDD